MPSSLIDTNILLYTHDPRDAAKQDRAAEVLNRLVSARSGVLSVQCLSEFFRVSTQRLPEPLSPELALAEVERFASIFQVVNLTQMVIVEGCRASIRHQLSIWDALIWSAAKFNQVPQIVTEDAQHGHLLEGVRYLNPFDLAFDFAVLG